MRINPVIPELRPMHINAVMPELRPMRINAVIPELRPMRINAVIPESSGARLLESTSPLGHATGFQTRLRRSGMTYLCAPVWNDDENIP